jgi:hypothetical protein
MHGLANAMLIAASLRSVGPGMPVPPVTTRFDIQNWGQPIAPWRNPLDHDLLYRPQEAADKLWFGPYAGGAKDIFIGPALTVPPVGGTLTGP